MLSIRWNPNGSETARGEGQRVTSGRRLLTHVSQSVGITIPDCLGSSREGQFFPKEAVKLACALGPGGRGRGVSGERKDPGHVVANPSGGSRSWCGARIRRVLNARGRH